MSGDREPRTHLINPYAVEHLNELLKDQDQEIYLGDYEPKVPRKRIHPNAPRKPGDRIVGKFPIHYGEREDPGSTSFGLLGPLKIGFVFVESGWLDPDSDYSGIYEILKMRIREPLLLNDGRTVPVCTIKQYVEKAEFGEELFDVRTDHVRRYALGIPLYWSQNDLSDILLPEWFKGPSRRIRDEQRREETAQLSREIDAIMAEE